MNKTIVQFMKKHFYTILVLLCPISMYSQNVGVGSPLSLMKLHVANDESAVVLLENTQASDVGVSTSLYFKTGNGSFPYTGGIKTIGTAPNFARLGFFTYAASSPNGLIERMSILDNGNVGIGTNEPDTKLAVSGEIRVDSIYLNFGSIKNLQDPIAAQDVATKAYVDVLADQVTKLEGVKDVENNTYKIVTIGTQTWMAENLKTTRFNDGTDIPREISASDWTQAGTSNSPAYCWYGNIATNSIPYGVLYNWFTINPATNGNKNVCPTGWHVPTDVEWNILRDQLDLVANGNTNIAGGEMKEAGYIHWGAPNTGGTNNSGLRGLPGGMRATNGGFSSLGDFGYYWSATQENTTFTLIRSLSKTTSNLEQKSELKTDGYSVRCIMD